LNKYGDVPNRETRWKAARRRANQELRKADLKTYFQEMEIKKAIGDEFLREERRAGRR
jgi:hypothetical protein